MIDVKSVSKSYGKIKAAENISFEIQPNDIIGFIGPNGSGKSTMMNIITGCLTADSGSVEINGYNILHSPNEAKRLIGYMPENPPLYPQFTVYEYLMLMCKFKRISVNAKAHTEEIMSLTGTAEVKNRRIGNLSKGYGQRVGFAQAMIGFPEYLILDEPTSGLDPNQKSEMLELIKKSGKNRGIMISSHILSEIDFVCSKLLIIDKGHIVSFGNKEEIIRTGSDSSDICFVYRVKGKASAVRRLLEEKCGVKASGCRQADSEFSVFSVNVKNAAETEKIFYTLAQNGIPVYAMECAGGIENAFINLTKKGL